MFLISGFFKQSSSSSPLTSDLHLKPANQRRETVKQTLTAADWTLFSYKQPPQGAPLPQSEECEEEEEEQEEESESTAGPIGGGGGFGVFLQVVTQSGEGRPATRHKSPPFTAAIKTFTSEPITEQSSREAPPSHIKTT